jgi:glycosyltransferase involved in cell wall biosynthesis
MSDLISVVTGFYNRGNLVRTSIGSLLRQTYTNLEIIVFDDCSTDHTYEELLKFQDPRLKVIRHSINIGFVNGLVDAVKRSSGNYIAIHGSGDISYPERLDKQYQLLSTNHNLGAVGCNVLDYEMLFDGSIYKYIRECTADQVSQSDLINGSNCFTHGEVMIRRKYYDQVGGYRRAFYYSQDRDLWLRLLEVSRFGVVNEVLYKRIFISNSIRFNLDKILIQRKYSELARQCAEMRMSHQPDLVDTYGLHALGFLGKSERLSNFYYQKFLVYMPQDPVFASQCLNLSVNEVFHPSRLVVSFLVNKLGVSKYRSIYSLWHQLKSLPTRLFQKLRS